MVLFRANVPPAVTGGTGFSSRQHAAVPDLQANAVCRGDFFSSQRGDADSAADLHPARGFVQELHEPSVLGVYLEEFCAGVVGHDFAVDHAGLFCDEYL